ncbi:MAG: hypothetical protein Q8R24_09735 [Legionellaceae bacterium]|nr:hypothetical protein [Legionellaceae bacterium]
MYSKNIALVSQSYPEPLQKLATQIHTLLECLGFQTIRDENTPISDGDPVFSKFLSMLEWLPNNQVFNKPSNDDSPGEQFSTLSREIQDAQHAYLAEKNITLWATTGQFHQVLLTAMAYYTLQSACSEQKPWTPDILWHFIVERHQALDHHYSECTKKFRQERMLEEESGTVLKHYSLQNNYCQWISNPSYQQDNQTKQDAYQYLLMLGKQLINRKKPLISIYSDYWNFRLKQDDLPIATRNQYLVERCEADRNMYRYVKFPFNTAFHVMAYYQERNIGISMGEQPSVSPQMQRVFKLRYDQSRNELFNALKNEKSRLSTIQCGHKKSAFISNELWVKERADFEALSSQLSRLILLEKQLQFAIESQGGRLARSKRTTDATLDARVVEVAQCLIETIHDHERNGFRVVMIDHKRMDEAIRITEIAEQPQPSVWHVRIKSNADRSLKVTQAAAIEITEQLKQITPPVTAPPSHSMTETVAPTMGLDSAIQEPFNVYESWHMLVDPEDNRQLYVLYKQAQSNPQAFPEFSRGLQLYFQSMANRLVGQHLADFCEAMHGSYYMDAGIYQLTGTLNRTAIASGVRSQYVMSFLQDRTRNTAIFNLIGGYYQIKCHYIDHALRTFPPNPWSDSLRHDLFIAQYRQQVFLAFGQALLRPEDIQSILANGENNSPFIHELALAYWLFCCVPQQISSPQETPIQYASERTWSHKKRRKAPKQRHAEDNKEQDVDIDALMPADANGMVAPPLLNTISEETWETCDNLLSRCFFYQGKDSNTTEHYQLIAELGDLILKLERSVADEEDEIKRLECLWDAYCYRIEFSVQRNQDRHIKSKDRNFTQSSQRQYLLNDLLSKIRPCLETLCLQASSVDSDGILVENIDEQRINNQRWQHYLCLEALVTIENQSELSMNEQFALLEKAQDKAAELGATCFEAYHHKIKLWNFDTNQANASHPGWQSAFGPILDRLESEPNSFLPDADDRYNVRFLMTVCEHLVTTDLMGVKNALAQLNYRDYAMYKHNVMAMLHSLQERIMTPKYADYLAENRWGFRTHIAETVLPNLTILHAAEAEITNKPVDYDRAAACYMMFFWYAPPPQTKEARENERFLADWMQRLMERRDSLTNPQDLIQQSKKISLDILNTRMAQYLRVARCQHLFEAINHGARNSLKPFFDHFEIRSEIASEHMGITSHIFRQRRAMLSETLTHYSLLREELEDQSLDVDESLRKQYILTLDENMLHGLSCILLCSNTDIELNISDSTERSFVISKIVTYKKRYLALLKEQGLQAPSKLALKSRTSPLLTQWRDETELNDSSLVGSKNKPLSAEIKTKVSNITTTFNSALTQEIDQNNGAVLKRYITLISMILDVDSRLESKSPIKNTLHQYLGRSYFRVAVLLHGFVSDMRDTEYVTFETTPSQQRLLSKLMDIAKTCCARSRNIIPNKSSETSKSLLSEVEKFQQILASEPIKDVRVSEYNGGFMTTSQPTQLPSSNQALDYSPK